MSATRYLLPLAALVIASPALAQSETTTVRGERVNTVFVFGDDPCPEAEGEDIVVCGRLDEGERYRIPEALRGDPNSPRRESWTQRVRALERVGRTGTLSCSPVGLGGFTGCLNDLVTEAQEERRQAANVDWTTTVSAERRRRLESFDAAARAQEEAIARDEAARRARTGETAPQTDADSAPLPDPRATRPPR